jgi:hypothetical protein
MEGVFGTGFAGTYQFRILMTTGLSADLSVVAEACGAFGLISADFLVVDPNQ